MSSSARKRFAVDCEEDVEVGVVDSVFCTPVALSFDHILDQIFDSLGPMDLLNCRLVSHRWLFFAQKPLQKQILLRFDDNEEHEFRNPVNRKKSYTKHITELIALLKKGESLPGCEFGEHIPIKFPCSRFYMDGTGLSNDHLQHFLNTLGPNIQELYVYPTFEGLPHENIVMDQMTNLLLHQAPNMQNVHLSIYATASWQIGNPDRSEESELQQTDPEYKEICQNARDLLQSVNASSLKVLHVNGYGVAKILEFVIRISPNLVEIIFNRENHYKYLLVPENRLYLLKSLRFGFDPEDNSSVEEMETISRGVLKLRRIEINLGRVNKWIENRPDFEPKITRMLNRIFQGSWDTLEEIELREFTFLRGMVMPQVMPKVKEIQIHGCRHETNANSNATVFPFGFNFQTTFPKLRRVQLANNMAKFSRFLNCLHFGADLGEPLSTSAKRVTLCFVNQRKYLHPSISQRIQRWFPNAAVETLGNK